MRVHASLGALAGIAWAASAAVVPRIPQSDPDSTCTSTTTEQATVVVTVSGPAPTATIGPATVITVTLAPGDPGLSAGSADAISGIDSSTCTSSNTLLSNGQGPSGTAAPVTVTLTELPTPPKSTVTVPVVTVTIPRGSGTSQAPGAPGTPSPANGSPGVTVVTVQPTDAPAFTVTVPLVPGVPTSEVTVTVPAPPANSAGSVITVTIPEGPSNTATVVLTVTVPNSGSPGSWSTVITAPGNPGATAGPVVTVTFTNSLDQPVTTTIPVAGPPGGTAVSGSNWIPLPVETITIPLSGAPDAGLPSPNGPVTTMTFTLGSEQGFPTPITETLTLPPGLPFGTVPGGPVGPVSPGTVTITQGISPTTNGGATPSATSTGSSCTSSPSTQLVTYTMPPQGTTPGYTAVFTMTIGPSVTWPAWTTPPATQPGVLTVTQPAATVSVFPITIPVGQGSLVTTVTVTVPAATPSAPSSNGQGGSSPGISGTSPTGQHTLVTVTVPQGSPGNGPGGQPGTVTLTVPVATVSVTPSAGIATTSIWSNNGQPGVVTVTVPQGASASLPPAGQPGQTSPAALGPSQVITVTVPGSSGASPSVYTVTVPAFGSSGLTPSGAFPPTPSSPAPGSDASQTGSIVVVTYTAPAKSGGTPSPYTVTYTVPPFSPGSDTTDSGYGGPPKQPTTSGPAPGSIAPVTVTIGTVSGTPVVVTYTPDVTAFSSQQPAVETITVNPSSLVGGPATVSVPGSGSNTLQPGQVTPVTITILPTVPGSPVVVVTYTPSPAASSPAPRPTDESPGYGADSGVATTIMTVTPVIGSPFAVTVTVPATLASTPGGDIATTIMTVTPAAGSPFAVTVTLPATVASTPVASPSDSGPPAYGADGGIATTVMTVTPVTGSPFAVTVTVPATTSSTPVGGIATTVMTVTPANGSPFAVTVTLPATAASTPVGSGPTVVTVPLPGGSSTVLTLRPTTLPGTPATVSVPTNQPAVVTVTKGLPTGPSSAISPDASVITVTPVSGSPLTITVPAGTQTISDGYPAAPTLSIVPTPVGGGDASVTVITITPASGSPLTITVPLSTMTGHVTTVTPVSGSPFVLTVPGAGPDATVTNTITPTIAPVLTITKSAGPSSTALGQTVVVSDLTLSETLPIGSGRFTVVEITTQVTVTPSAGLSSTTAPVVSVTPVVVTYTLSDAYGVGSTVLTYTTFLPVASTTAADADAGVTTLTMTTTPGAGSGSGSLASPQVITIWPTDAYGSQFPLASPIVVTVDPDSNSGSPSPTVLTIWPLQPTSHPSATPTTSCSLEDGGSAAESNTDAMGTLPGSLKPSVITIWPTGTPSDTTCTTLSTRFRSTDAFGNSDPTATSVRFSVVTIRSTLRGSSPSGPSTSSSCTSEIAPLVTTVAIQSITPSTPSQPTSESAVEPAGQSIGISEEATTAAPTSEGFPPPQTELHQHAHTVISGALSLSGDQLISSAQGYGNPVPMYGTPSPLLTSSGRPSSKTSSSAAPTVPIVSTIASTSGSSPGATASSALPLNGTTTSSETLPTGTPAIVTSPTAIGASEAPVSTGLNTTATSLPTVSSAPTSGNATSPTGTATLPSPTCGGEGDRGEVVFQFDDIPTIQGGNGTDPNSLPAQPMPFPHHRFFFSTGFSVVTSQASRYEASSGTQMVQYNTSLSPTGQIGLAALRENPCMRFNFIGIGLGCDSTDLPCVFDVRGLQWNGVDEVLQANRTFEISACPDNGNCTLRHQLLDSASAVTFTNLTAINITLTVGGGEPRMWWGDDLQIAWTDNDCTTAACRARIPNTVMRISGSKSKNFFRWSSRRRHAGRH